MVTKQSLNDSAYFSFAEDLRTNNDLLIDTIVA